MVSQLPAADKYFSRPFWVSALSDSRAMRSESLANEAIAEWSARGSPNRARAESRKVFVG